MSPKLRKKARAMLIDRDGLACIFCGCKLSREAATLDHLTPKSKGGTNSIWNLILSCWRCNQAKADLMPLDFMIYLNWRTLAERNGINSITRRIRNR